MGKLETALKLEIIRLARRETRKMVSKQTGELRRLSRKVSDLEAQFQARKKQDAKEASRNRLVQATDARASDGDKSRLSPKLIKKLRVRLNLSQPELAKLLGVSLSAVGFWESGRVRPRPEMRTRIVALRRLGRRDVRRLLADMAAANAKAPAEKKPRGRKKKAE